MWTRISAALLLCVALSATTFTSANTSKEDIPFTAIPKDELLKFSTLTNGLLDAEVFGTAFKKTLEKMAMPSGDCSIVRSSPPASVECTDLSSVLSNFYAQVSYSSCDVGFTGFIDALVNPLFALATNIRNCFGQESNGDRALLEEEKQHRELQSTVNLQCVERFEEGDYDNLVDPAQDVPAELTGAVGLLFEGGFNQYAWGTNFNERLRFGVIIHSTGSPGALQGQYSLPTFTIRDDDANIVFEGVYASPLDTNGRVLPTVGLRSALVVDVQFPVVTVLACTVGVPGEFQLFEFDLSQYNGIPIFGVEPVKTLPFDAPSVRAVRLISRDLVVYAPLFDVGGSLGFPFLRVFNWRRFRDIDTNFVLTNVDINGGQTDDSILPGLLWDFECEDEGLCFVNSIETIDPDETVVGDEETIPRLSYFPLEDIRRFAIAGVLAPALIPRRVLIPTQILDTTFDIGYSAQSFEPVSKEQSVVCTLSGFLFRLSFLLNNDADGGNDIGGDIDLSVAVPEFDTLEGLQEGLDFFELGKEQQCDICTGVDKTPTGPLNIIPTGTGECARVQLVGQRTTTAYIWAVEECGGKFFIGTYDIASVLSDVIFGVVIQQQAELVCGGPIGLQTACAFSGQCTGDPFNDLQVCIEFTSDSIQNNFPPVSKLELQADIIASIFGEAGYTGEEFGFDLYVIEKADLLLPNPVATPVTQNGFRSLAGGSGGGINLGGNPFTFDPSSQLDDAIRNMVCHKDPFTGSESLIIGSAVFAAEATSNTYVLDPDCLQLF